MKFSQAVLGRYTVRAETYIVNGSADSWLSVYDLIANRRSMRISRAHSNDVNSVCWADTSSGNVLISGSDDGFVKVW
jgi:WD repeat-containing protein 23